MSLYNCNNTTVKVFSDGELSIKKELPLNTYVVNYNDMSNEYYLTVCNDLPIVDKVYGNIHDKVSIVLEDYLQGDKSLGLMLSGKSGMGKSLTIKLLSLEAKKQGISTVLINDQFYGENFFRFIQKIEEKVLVVSDEFEKVYNKHSNELLTLFDGVFPTNKLFVLSLNEYSDISEYLMNRTTRIKYHFRYNNLEKSVIDEIIEDKLIDREGRKQELLRGISLISEVNIDTLCTLIDVVNNQPTMSVATILDMLNITTLLESQLRKDYTANVFLDGEDVTKYLTRKEVYNYNLSGYREYDISFHESDFLDYLADRYEKVKDILNDEEHSWDVVDASASKDDLVELDADNNLVFKINYDGLGDMIIVLKSETPKSFNATHLL